jgi:hypothetical protein
MNTRIVSTGKPTVSSEMAANPRQASVFRGIDVSAETLAVAVIEPGHPLQRREFANPAIGAV